MPSGWSAHRRAAAAGRDDVVLAQVVEITAIPGADRIRRVVVDRGAGEAVEVVCGAWNFAVGDVVPLAPVGAELPGGFKIERRKMKGVVSNGMICSARELALGDDHEGILVLASLADGSPAQPSAGVELGRSLADHLGIRADVVFDLAIEANRPDCLCMLGVARDLAARFKLPLYTPQPDLRESDPPAGELASVASVLISSNGTFEINKMLRTGPRQAMPVPGIISSFWRFSSTDGTIPISARPSASRSAHSAGIAKERSNSPRSSPCNMPQTSGTVFK